MKKIKYEVFLKDWLENKRYYVKISTYATYSNIVYNFIIPDLGNIYLKDFNHDMVQKYIIELSMRKKKNGGYLSSKMIKDVSVLIKRTLRDAVYVGLCKDMDWHFLYSKVDNKNKRVKVLNKCEQEMIIKSLKGSMCARNLGIILSLFMGLRIGEVCALKFRDIDFVRREIRVVHTIQRVYIKGDKNISYLSESTVKTLSSNRVIPLNDFFYDLLRKYYTCGDDYLLTLNKKSMEPRSYRRYFSNFLLNSGVKHVNYHVLRHTFATNCISEGIDYKTVSEVLGHSNINTTFNLYVHPSYQDKVNCLDRLTRKYLFDVKIVDN